MWMFFTIRICQTSQDEEINLAMNRDILHGNLLQNALDETTDISVETWKLVCIDIFYLTWCCFKCTAKMND